MNPEARPLTSEAYQARKIADGPPMNRWLNSQYRKTSEIVQERARRAGIADLIQVEPLHPEITPEPGHQPGWCVVVWYFNLHTESWVKDGYHFISPSRAFQVLFPGALLEYENNGRTALPEPDYRMKQA